MSESLIFNFSSTQDACFDRLRTEIYSYLNTFSKDEISLIENNKSLIFNLQNSNQSGSHWIALSRKDNNIFIFDSFGVAHKPKNIYDIYKNFYYYYKHI